MRNEADQFAGRKNDVGQRIVLPLLAVEDGLDFQGVGIGDFILGDEGRAERTEGVERLAAAPLAASKILLPIAGRDVVAAGVAEDVVEGVFLGGVLAGLADDDGELAFVIDLRAFELRR